MKYQKQNWRNIRQNMREKKQVINPNSQKLTKSVGLSTFMRNMDEVILNSNWHIISIDQQMSDSGILRVWVQTENQSMFPIKLKFPRFIYINSKVQSDNKDFKKVNKFLPRNRKVYHLYEWETSEEVY